MADSNTLTWVLGVAASVIGASLLAGTGAIIKNGTDIQSLKAQIQGIQDSRDAITERFEKTRDQVNQGRVERAKLQEQIKALQK